MEKQDIANFIDEMIDVLREDGWCRFYYTSPTGSHCIRGAQEKVANRGYAAGVAASVHVFLFSLASLREWPNVTSMNDEVFTCEDDAVRFLKEAKDAL